jgi:uncharacterized protein YxeA
MSGSRVAVVAVIIVAFLVAGGVLIYVNQSHGGGSVTLDATVSGARSMSPDTLNAHLNDEVTLNVTSDQTGEVHLHGYDIPINCTAGQVTTVKFKADKSGQFEIEWESTSTHLGFLVVS